MSTRCRAHSGACPFLRPAVGHIHPWAARIGTVTLPQNAPDSTLGPGPAAGDRPSTLVDAEIDDVPAAAPSHVGSRRGLVYLGLCLVLIGLNLRTVFSSFSAVLPEAAADAGLPGWAVVVLTTVPVTLNRWPL